MMCPNCGCIVRHTKTEQTRTKRREMVYNNVDEDINLETLYRRLRMRGYPLSRKTFARDVDYLCDIQALHKEVLPKDNGGFYTMVKKQGDE